MNSRTWLCWVIAAGWTGLLSEAAGSEEKSATPEEIFEERILPIFRSADPSSCTQCHLSGVELRNYILPTQEKTFANLRDLGLIDLKTPEQSRILELIGMEPKESEQDAVARIDPKMRAAELAAFSSWIQAAAKDPTLRNAPSLPAKETAAPALPNEVIRHGRVDRLLESYVSNIWSLRFRCAGCHHPSGPKFEKHAKKHGVEAMAWLKAEGPAASMRYLMSSDLIDLENPEESELLLKPLNVSDHGGGEKMRAHDTDYVAFLSWIEDYARIMKGEYADQGSLPSGPKRQGTQIWVRVGEMSSDDLGRTGFLAVHRGDAAQAPIAVASGTVVENKRLGVFLHGFLMVSDGKQLGDGPVKLRLYLDRGERESSEWDEAIGKAEWVGTREVKAKWEPGFKNAVVVNRASFGKGGR